ncbi:MAG: aspartate--tRNA ligase [Bacteroidetes bacterium HGW-Bacteroidetes-6]|jgi:aspartyl-tRNA synthetase|nr:MAG: aspartate--tRNA ligase [Bacteroidetes bacterium HGW-Bacteroidetes-6]
MYRTHTCGELRTDHVGQTVVISGWVQHIRDFGGTTFIDLRDRYGITQLVFDMETNKDLCESARKLGREYVITATGLVRERSNKNKNIATGEIEMEVLGLKILNPSQIPPFTIETETDGGEELRMKYRYLDLRRNPLQQNVMLRHRMALEIRKFLSDVDFLEIETPYLIRSTPEGARDFIVPSRMNENQFYALPQSPQTYKQLLMVSGFDRYFQIVRCFRDEDLRADRQPEFTQIDCEMSFVEREDVLVMFEKLTCHLLKTIRNVDLPPFMRMPYSDAISLYGSDKPDIRFGMQINDISEQAKNKGFVVFDNADRVLALVVEGAAEYTRKQIDDLTDWVKRPQIGGSGLIWVKYAADGTTKSSVDKFFSANDLKDWKTKCHASDGDLMLIVAGAEKNIFSIAGELRLELGSRQGLRNPDHFAPLWVVDFPLLEWDDEAKRFFAMHHPFTSPVVDDIEMLLTDPGKVRANAYDLVINGVEIGGGSIRIHDRVLQMQMFKALGFSDEEATAQFGFLLGAFEFGAPPHGGIAFGFDRFVAMMAGQNNIREFIAFPKNNSGRDVMADAPSTVSSQQLDELNIKLISR